MTKLIPEEIEIIVADGILPSKFKSCETTGAQVAPKLLFLFCGVAPEPPSHLRFVHVRKNRMSDRGGKRTFFLSSCVVCGGERCGGKCLLSPALSSE